MIIAPRRDQPLTDKGTPTNRFAEYLEELATVSNQSVEDIAGLTANQVVPSQDTYTVLNSSVLRTYDPNTVTLPELADYVATLTASLQDTGIVK